MGDLLLTGKEASGLVIKNIETARIPQPRWAVVGKVCSPRKLVISALERAMVKAWGLHCDAQFKDIGENRFVVRFSSEGDWKHVRYNGPWQFDFNVILLKDYAGSVHPSDMVFDSLELWVRVLDLPMDKMNRVYGELIGGWIGKYISTDMDEDGYAWGKDLCIRVNIKVEQPLLRGVNLRESDDDEEGKWFDIKYEKVPHFCFDCGRLVHPEGGCVAEKEEVPQWGESLRASPARNYKPPPLAHPTVSSSSFYSRSSGSDMRSRVGAFVRDIPPRRSLYNDYEYSSSSRTGGSERRRDTDDVSIFIKGHRARAEDKLAGKQQVEQKQHPTKGAGTFTRRQRKQQEFPPSERLVVPQGNITRKRGTKQVWQRISVQVVGDEGHEYVEKRQRTGSVFDRLEDPAADPEDQGCRAQ
jgi:hypothetical protein